MTTTAAACFAVAFFLLPGFLVAWVAGLRAPAAVASALPVTFGIIGAGSWMWGLTSAPLNLWTYGVSLALALGLAALWRSAFARRARKRGAATWRAALFGSDWRHRSIADPAWVLPAVGVAVGAWLAITDRLRWLVRAPHGVYNVVQGWDVQWHANLVRFIMDTGVASSTRMGELQNIETHADLLYPSAFHAGIALFGEAAGLEAVPALNIGHIVLSGLALPLSMACLTMAFLRSRGVTAQIAAGLAPILIYAAPQVYWIGDYVGMWPYLFAMSLAGIVIWQFLTVPAVRAGALPTALGFFGLLSCHPSAVTVVVIAVGLAWLTSLLIRPERSRVGDALWIAAPALAGAVAFLPQILAGSEQAEEVAGWQTPEGVAKNMGWESILMMDTRHVAEFFPDYDPTVLLWLAAAGGLIALLWRGQLWPALFYALSLCAAIQAVDPFDSWFGDAMGAVSNLHYNTAHRLILPVAMSVAAGAAIAIAAMIRLATLAPLAERKNTAGWRRATTAASAVAALVFGGLAVPAVREPTLAGAEEAFRDPRTGGRMVDDSDLAAFAWLASRPEAYEGYTMGDPADGHSWIYALTGVPTISRHYQWPTGGRGSDTDIIFSQANMIGEGLRGKPNATNVADEAVEALDVNFFIASPMPFWWYQRQRMEINFGLWATRGVTPVYRKDHVVVFAVNEQFSPKELKDMRADALKHGSDSLPELTDGSGATSAVQ